MAIEMDLFLSVLISIFSILLCLISSIHLKKTSKRTKKLPPGEMGLPWVGETIDFYKAQRKNRLFEDFVQPRTRKHGTIFKTRLIGSPTIVVSGSAANKFFLSNEFKLVISSWPSTSVELMGKESIMEKHGDQHRFIRGLIASSLNYSGLEALVPKICNSVQMHLKSNWQGQETISLFRSTKMLTFSIVFECLFGIKVEPGMLNMFERVLEGVFAPAIELPGTKFWRAKRARMEIEKMLVNVVRQKRMEIEKENSTRGEESGALLSRLLAGLIRGDISEMEVVDNIVLLVFAAHDTTSFAISMVCRMLAHHPHCYARLLQEHEEIMASKGPTDTHLTIDDTKKMKYTWQCARESMRLFPPIFGSFRKAIVDIDYEGFTIPKGWKVLWTTYGSHYDAENFSDPMNFDPSRFEEPVPPYVFVPFGGGPRVCAGYQLAKLNILIFLHYMATGYNWSMVHPDEPITMDPLPFPYYGMPIKISPKSHKV